MLFSLLFLYPLVKAFFVKTRASVHAKILRFIFLKLEFEKIVNFKLQVPPKQLNAEDKDRKPYFVSTDAFKR